MRLRRKPKLQTTLPPSHPMNYLGIDADPVMVTLPVYGQVLILVQAPAGKFLTTEQIFCEGRRLFDLQDVDVIPSHFYARDEENDGYVRAD